ncbi:histone acetyltransferase [Rhizophlyctis rosea]|nr:histone acetyltransferase [Rhizophlyctis rosea]
MEKATEVITINDESGRERHPPTEVKTLIDDSGGEEPSSDLAAENAKFVVVDDEPDIEIYHFDATRRADEDDYYEPSEEESDEEPMSDPVSVSRSTAISLHQKPYTSQTTQNSNPLSNELRLYMSEPRCRPRKKVWVEIPYGAKSGRRGDKKWNIAKAQKGTYWAQRPNKKRRRRKQQYYVIESEDSEYAADIYMPISHGGRRTKRQHVQVDRLDPSRKRQRASRDEGELYSPGPAIDSLDEYDQSDFLSFYLFCCNFSEELEWDPWPVQWIHEAFLATSNVFLADLVMRLLQLIPRGESPRYATWEHVLRREVVIRSAGQNWPEDVSFGGLDATVKLGLLRQLCQWAVDDSEICRQKDPREMRVDPVGKDADGKIYWHFDVDSLRSRLYCEVPHGGLSTWHLVASNRQEWHEFISRLKTSHQRANTKLRTKLQNIWKMNDSNFDEMDDSSSYQSAHQQRLLEKDHMQADQAYLEAVQAKQRAEEEDKRREARLAAQRAAAAERKRRRSEAAVEERKRRRSEIMENGDTEDGPAVKRVRVEGDGPMPSKGKDRAKQLEEWERRFQLRKAVSEAERKFFSEMLCQSHNRHELQEDTPRWKRVPITFDRALATVDDQPFALEGWENVEFTKEIMTHGKSSFTIQLADARPFMKPCPGAEMNLTLKQACKYILDGLRLHTNITLFLVPVDRADFPDYYLAVKHPVDIQTIWTRLVLDNYKHFDEFVKDTLLIFSNCRFYNDPGSEIVEQCTELEEYLWRLLRGLGCLDDGTGEGGGGEGEGEAGVGKVGSKGKVGGEGGGEKKRGRKKGSGKGRKPKEKVKPKIVEDDVGEVETVEGVKESVVSPPASEPAFDDIENVDEHLDDASAADVEDAVSDAGSGKSAPMGMMEEFGAGIRGAYGSGKPLLHEGEVIFAM